MTGFLGCDDEVDPATDAGPADAMVEDTRRSDGGGDGSVADPVWTVVYDDLPGAVLSAWGDDEGNVYFAGGGLGNGMSALAVRYDGERFARVAAETTETFWWVWGSGADDIFFVGTGGAIYHSEDGEVATAMESPTTATLFGVWGSAPDDVWAVGGDPVAGTITDVILHYDGSRWSQVTLPSPTGRAFFKVWGTGPDDVFIVGQRGTILHYDGEAWTPMESPVTASLFTGAGTGPRDVWVVGGPPTALLHYDGSEWEELEPVGPATALNGVCVSPGGNVFAVGFAGVKWRHEAGEWYSDEVAPWVDLHGCWSSPTNTAFAVGGDFVAPALATRRGVIAYYGGHAPVKNAIE